MFAGRILSISHNMFGGWTGLVGEEDGRCCGKKRDSHLKSDCHVGCALFGGCEKGFCQNDASLTRKNIFNNCNFT